MGQDKKGDKSSTGQGQGRQQQNNSKGGGDKQQKGDNGLGGGAKEKAGGAGGAGKDKYRITLRNFPPVSEGDQSERLKLKKLVEGVFKNFTRLQSAYPRDVAVKGAAYGTCVVDFHAADGVKEAIKLYGSTGLPPLKGYPAFDNITVGLPGISHAEREARDAGGGAKGRGGAGGGRR